MSQQRCIKCEKEFTFIEEMTPISEILDPKTIKKLQYGDIYEDAIAMVDIHRRVGGCVELAASTWNGSLCEKCMGELVQKKLLEEVKDI
jgi:hypothetical protein